MTFVLRALDGSLAGASHREIAEALIGEGRVQADRKDPGDHLRDRIRCAVALMNAGTGTSWSKWRRDPHCSSAGEQLLAAGRHHPIRPVYMAANSLAGAHRFKDGVDA
ncbi:DUF2285 domain-containing protein [Mesorhizobium sp.]|uniref:DNA -binding domain-containing protein n=1 Tax=Mesorhizobium sp. TaxID=1871066 RepID=UPI00257C1AD4|nr:DUF2285 domain-containing protein [Mesorhizobium sp.]